MSNRLYETPEDFIAMLKSRPDHMIVTHKFIAVWHTGLETAILIPGRFEHISNEAAENILNENLKALHAQILS